MIDKHTPSFSLDTIANDILEVLRNEASNIVSSTSLSSPRAIGDAVQEYLAESGLSKVLLNYGIDVKSEFGRRSMEDIAFKDARGNYYAVDVKTHNLGTEFNMPNLISVKRLANFYKNDDNNHFCILIIEYIVSDSIIDYRACHFRPIESFEWSCLTIGALGWGQIQITNANTLIFNDSFTRKDWMLSLCDKLETFYDEEIAKIGERKTWFLTMKEYWKDK